MKMQGFIKQLDLILSSSGREILQNSGKINHLQAEEKAKIEFNKYHNKTLSEVEKSYLETLKQLEKSIKKKN